MSTAIFVKDADDLDYLPNEILHNGGDIFTFSISAHKRLQDKKIIHYFADRKSTRLNSSH